MQCAPSVEGSICTSDGEWRRFAPSGPGWLHEMKLDGYRMHARIESGTAKILTRRGNDWADRYPTADRRENGENADLAPLHDQRR